VLRSRFTPERGYLIESQRGGHGYIKILKIGYEMPQDKIDHIEAIIGDSINEQEAKNLLAAFQERGLITSRERLLAEVSLRFTDELGSSVFDISPYKRNVLQAELLKRMLRSLALS
jgi:transcriptional regulator CtsR